MFDVRYTNDIVLLIWMGIVLLLCKGAKKKKVTILGQEEERYSLLFAALVFYPIFWFVTTVFARSDMYAYWTDFDNSNMSISEVLHNWTSISRGPGYYLIISISKSLGINTFQQFRVVLALLHSVPLVLVYWRYSESYVYSVFLFIATLSYDGWMMNGMRQFTAAAIVFAALPLLIRKKYVLTLLVVLLAMTVHQSALIMIPILFISQLKPWTLWTILSFVAFAFILLIYVNRSGLIGEESMQYSSGSNPIRIVINAIPVGIAFVKKNDISLKNNRLINMCINISVITVIIYIISTFTSGILVGRLPGYTTIFNFLLYPYLLNKVYNEKISKNLKVFVTIFYIVYFIVDLYYI